MERTIDLQLEELKKTILEMGGYVEKALKIAIDGLLKQDLKLLNSVHEIEKNVNDLQIKIDNLCLSLLAKQGPVAKDLRLILSVIKINTDLERMGDQCVNISYLGKDLALRSGPSIPMNEIDRMSGLVSEMVKGSLDSFVRMDADAATQILKMDDEVDALKNAITAAKVKMIKADASLTESCLDIIQVARNLERLGDHSTNIAEDVIFAFTGKDIRHGAN